MAQHVIYPCALEKNAYSDAFGWNYISPCNLMCHLRPVSLMIFCLICLCCCCLVSQLCLTLCNPIDYSLPGSSVHGTSQAGILEWVAISFSRGIFLTQGSNLCLLHWQVDSLPLSHQEAHIRV